MNTEELFASRIAGYEALSQAAREEYGEKHPIEAAALASMPDALAAQEELRQQQADHIKAVLAERDRTRAEIERFLRAERRRARVMGLKP